MSHSATFNGTVLFLDHSKEFLYSLEITRTPSIEQVRQSLLPCTLYATLRV